jgi:hypothetical protein
MPPPLAKKQNQLAILSKKLEVRTINASVSDDFVSLGPHHMTALQA